MKHLSLALLSAVIHLSHPWAALAEGAKESWFLPNTIMDNNAHVRFEVDSTWHLVEGKTKHIAGKIFLNDPKNPSSIEAHVSLPVNEFDTDSSDRDEEMRSVMASDRFPLVEFIGMTLKNGCTPARAEKEGGCADILPGKLTIRGVTLPVELPVQIQFKDDSFTVSGSFNIKWADYGVEDPSILIARLHEVVTIYFDVTLSPQ